MSGLYMKGTNGNFYPVEFKTLIDRDWENKVIVVRLGTDENPADEKEEDEMYDALNNADALDALENTSFIVTSYQVDIEMLSSINEIKDKCVTVAIKSGDDLSKLKGIKKKVKEQLRGKAKKVVVMPAPLTINEYKEVMEVKNRCDTRRNRRGR